MSTPWIFRTDRRAKLAGLLLGCAIAGLALAALFRVFHPFNECPGAPSLRLGYSFVSAGCAPALSARDAVMPGCFCGTGAFPAARNRHCAERFNACCNPAGDLVCWAPL